MKLKDIKIEYWFFGFFLVFLTVKYLLVTNLNNDAFLQTYKFVSSDSYDWIANGVGLFNNDSITFRNPGLPIIIKILDGLKVLFLLPLLNQVVFWTLGIYIYRISRFFSNKLVSLLITLFVYLNYSFNLGANFILSDFYAILFISISVYYLLKKRFLFSFSFLGISVLFQNFAYFLIPLFLAAFIYANRENLRKFTIKNIFKKSYPLFVFFVIIAPWHIYKYFAFGDALYTKVEQFGLINPNLNSILFYFVNSLVLFGIIIIPFVFYISWNIKKFSKDKSHLFLLGGSLITFVFWVILYDWDDKRFLLYFIPWIYPLIAWFLTEIKTHFGYKLLLLILVFYPTTLPTSAFLTNDEIPLVHNLYLKIRPDGTRKRELSLIERKDFESLLMNISPTIFNSLENSQKFVVSESTWYAFYSDYVEQNFNQTNNSICIDKERGIRKYFVQSILIINKNSDLSSTNIYDCTI